MSTRLDPSNFYLDGDTLVIRGTDCPAGWRHILPDAKAFSLFTAFGQGEAVDRDPSILQYVYPSRYFYVYDTQSGEAFSPTWLPLMARLDSYEVRMAPWKVEYRARSSWALESVMSASIDPVSGAECWTVRLRNSGPAPRSVHFAAVIPFANLPSQGDTGFALLDNRIVGKKIRPRFSTREQYEASRTVKTLFALCSDRTPSSFSTSLRDVFPHHETATCPGFLKRGDLGNTLSFLNICCAAMDFELNLASGEEDELHLGLTAQADVEGLQFVQQRVAAKTAPEEARKRWEEWNEPLEVSFPNDELSAFTNTFLKHQVRLNCITARWSLAPATRNWVLDWQAAAYLQPVAAIDAFHRALRSQKSNGFIPQGFPLTEKGRLVNMHNMDFRDSPMWFPTWALTLFELQGDTGFLLEHLPYADGGEGSAVDHLLRGLRFMADNRGERGLVLFGEGDWNDQINNAGIEGRGESTLLSAGFVRACRDYLSLCELAALPCVPDVRQWIGEVSRAMNAEAWDGNWYIRGITDGGTRFGSSQNQEGSIYINPQSWSILADIPDTARRETIMRAVRDHLGTPYGVLLLHPAYTRWDADIGRITLDLPGNKENGSAYCHGTLFYAQALFHAGHIDEAAELLLSVLPGNPENPFYESVQMPNYLPNAYLGVGAGEERAGKGSNHNFTGSASTLFHLVLHDLLGIRGTRGGLRIEPGLPRRWSGTRCSLRFRSVRFDIHYETGADTGVFVEDAKMPDSVVPLPCRNSHVKVRVVY